MKSVTGFLKPVSSVLKKYKSLVPSAAITIAALLVVLVTMSIGGQIKEGMDKSVQSANSVQSLLNDIPSRQEVEQLKIHMDQLEEASNRIKELACQSSQRDLITYEYKIFPEPDDESQQIYFEYADQYRTAVEKLVKSMNALDAPSDAEIRAKTGGVRKPTAFRGQTIREEIGSDSTIDAICLSRAQEISVYANPSAFPWYSFWESYEFTGKNQALEDCWNSQTAFWVYEDVVDTVRKMNGDTGNVLSAPVKRILGVNFNGPVKVATGKSNRGYSRMLAAGMRDNPVYVSQTSRSKLLGSSPTARICDDDLDIIHFAVSVLVDSRSVLPFMKELCSEKPHSFYPSIYKEPFIQEGELENSRHNQITILESNMQVVDKDNSDHELYCYGKGAVVRMDLICEYQFNRAGYDMIKPKPIKKNLGQLEEGDEQDGTPGTMMPGGMPGMMR